jgi:hypothetical protein
MALAALTAGRLARLCPSNRRHEQEDPGRHGGAKRKHDAAVEPLHKPPGGKLQRGHRPGIDAAERTQHAVAQAELSLPQGKQDVDQVGVAVVQGVGSSGDRQCAPGGCRPSHLNC